MSPLFRLLTCSSPNVCNHFVFDKSTVLKYGVSENKNKNMTWRTDEEDVINKQTKFFTSRRLF